MKIIKSSLFVLLFCVCILSALCATVPALAATQSGIDRLEQQRDELRERQNDVQEQLEALQSGHDTLLDQKSALDEQSELIRQDLLLLEEQIKLCGAAIEEKRFCLAEARLEEQRHYEILCSRLRYMEENGRKSYLSFIFKAADLSDLLSRLADVRDIMRYDEKLRSNFIAAREGAETLLAEYQAAQDERMAKQSQLSVQRKQLQEKIDSSAALIAQLENDIESYKEYYESVGAEMAKVQQLIDEKAEELRKQQLSQQLSPPSSGSGYYAWPSQCTVISSPFGPRVHPIYGQLKPHTGVDIAAGYGSAVTAAASGTVSLAVVDYGSIGYGTYAAIYHPNGTTTLYAHMSALAVSVGQSVSQGQIIGYVGSTGASNGPHIHFEIRSNGVCVDPVPYFSIPFYYQ